MAKAQSYHEAPTLEDDSVVEVSAEEAAELDDALREARENKRQGKLVPASEIMRRLRVAQ